MCLVCGRQVAMFKDYNLKRHYMTKQEEKYKNLFEEQHTKGAAHTKLCTPKNAAIKKLFPISEKSLERVKCFLTEFIKECLMNSAVLICLEKKGAFENVPLFRCTVTRRVQGLTRNLELQHC